MAEIRRAVEEHAPYRVYLLAVGGFRWLALAVSFAPLSLATVRVFRDVRVEPLVVLIENNLAMRELIKRSSQRRSPERSGSLWW